MKMITLTLFTVFSLSAFASIDHNEAEAPIDHKRVETSRACFNELEILGCRHPREGVKDFKLCLENNQETLTEDCGKLMAKLYGRKK